MPQYGAKLIGASTLIRKLKQHPQLVGREYSSLIRQEARALAVELGRVSGPGQGLTETPLDKARAKVATDMVRVFATRDRPGQVFRLLRQVDLPTAKAYYHKIKSQKPRAAADILRSSAVPRGIDMQLMASLRTAPGGRVPETIAPQRLVESPQLRTATRSQQQRVGMAKAAWYQAARALGGRVRGSYQRGESIVNAEKFPASVRRVASRFPGLGGAVFSEQNGRFRAEIFSNVGHGRKALAASVEQTAVDVAQGKLASALQASLDAIHAKLFKSA